MPAVLDVSLKPDKFADPTLREQVKKLAVKYNDQNDDSQPPAKRQRGSEHPAIQTILNRLCRLTGLNGHFDCLELDEALMFVSLPVFI